ncbi:MAG: hypothetical protein AAGK22_10615 [Acidobacteriota bacterium]
MRTSTVAWPQAQQVVFLQGNPTSSSLPKVFVTVDPGSILTSRQRQLCRGWPGQTEITVAGLHFIPEDAPDEVGAPVVGLLDGSAARGLSPQSRRR